MSEHPNIIIYLKQKGYAVAISEHLTVIKLPKFCTVLFDQKNRGKNIVIKFGKVQRKTAILISIFIYTIAIFAYLKSIIGPFVVFMLVLAIFWDISRYRKSEEVILEIQEFYKK